MSETLSDLLENFANNIRVGRSIKRLSQRELAVLAGVSSQTIGNLEQQKTMPTLKVVSLVADALSRSPLEMLQQYNLFGERVVEPSLIECVEASLAAEAATG